MLPAHGFEVVARRRRSPGAAGGGRRATEPDVALIDIRMPPTFTDEGITGRDDDSQSVTRTVGVIVLSQHVDADYALTLLQHDPARTATCSRTASPRSAVLADAIERVGRGETVLDPELVDLLLHRPAEPAAELDELTAREREVLALLAEGLTDRGIGERLWLTPKTVETHVRHILQQAQPRQRHSLQPPRARGSRLHARRRCN